MSDPETPAASLPVVLQEPHAGYGPCDGFGPGGACSECSGEVQMDVDEIASRITDDLAFLTDELKRLQGCRAAALPAVFPARSPEELYREGWTNAIYEHQTLRDRLAALVTQLDAVVKGFEDEALNGVICTPPDTEDGGPLWDDPPSRRWCARCRSRWAKLRALPDKFSAFLVDPPEAVQGPFLSLCAEHQPDKCEGDGSCVICEGQQLSDQVKDFRVLEGHLTAQRDDLAAELTAAEDQLAALTTALAALPRYAFDEQGVIYGPVDAGRGTFVLHEDLDALAEGGMSNG